MWVLSPGSPHAHARPSARPYDMPVWVRFEICPFSSKNSVNWGVGGVPKFFLSHWNPNICVTWKRERRNRNNANDSGHLRLCQQPRAAHALRSDQN